MAREQHKGTTAFSSTSGDASDASANPTDVRTKAICSSVGCPPPPLAGDSEAAHIGGTTDTTAITATGNFRFTRGSSKGGNCHQLGLVDANPFQSTVRPHNADKRVNDVHLARPARPIRRLVFGPVPMAGAATDGRITEIGTSTGTIAAADSVGLVRADDGYRPGHAIGISVLSVGRLVGAVRCRISRFRVVVVVVIVGGGGGDLRHGGFCIIIIHLHPIGITALSIASAAGY